MSSCAEGFSKEYIAKYIAEFIGTAWLVLVIKLSVQYFDYPSLSIGLGLCAIIYTYGYVSKAHYNPSITVAFAIRNIPEWPRKAYVQIIMYFVSEYLGALTGGLIGWCIGGDVSGSVYPSVNRNFDNHPSGIILFRAFIAELVFTFILASVILSVATDKRQSGNQYYGLAIGLTVTASINCIGKFTGSCLNSAVWFGCVIPALIIDNNIDLSDAWIYWIAPFLGGIIAALLFNVVYGTYKIKDDKCDTQQLTCVVSSSNVSALNGSAYEMRPIIGASPTNRERTP